MTNTYETLVQEAKTRWDALKGSPIPVIYFGTASCGRAAGAMDVLEAVQKTLE